MKRHLENVPRLHQGWPVVSPCGPGGSSGGGGRGVGHICQVGTGHRGQGRAAIGSTSWGVLWSQFTFYLAIHFANHL